MNTTAERREYIFPKNWFQVLELRSSLRAIREPQHFEDVISYLLDLGKEIVLIDSGMGLANIREVLPPDKKVTLLLTHTHWDHVGGAADFDATYVFDSSYANNRLAKGWSKDETVGYEPQFFSQITPEQAKALENFKIPGVRVFHGLHDGDTLFFSGTEVKVIHTPGHTPDGVSFYLPQTGELFTGDTLYPGPEYLHLSESDARQYLDSLRKISKITSSQLRRIYPGHNQPISDPSLLDDHRFALEGKLEPSKTEQGKDEFGEYLQLFYANFSLMLPNGRRA